MLDYHFIGKRIRMYRKRRGYTQEELGLSIDTSGPYISNIERAVKKPSLENLADIAEVLGVTLNDLVSPPETENDYKKGLESLVRHCSSGSKMKIRSSLNDIINLLEQES